MTVYTTAPTPDIELVFQALGDTSRRKIIELLSEQPKSASQMITILSMSLPAVMQHIRILENVGLVSTKKVGRIRTCRLNPQALAYAEGWLSTRQQTWLQRLDCLEP